MADPFDSRIHKYAEGYQQNLTPRIQASEFSMELCERNASFH